MSLTVDGLGGIIPGDIIQTDYIQPKYNETVGFTKHFSTMYLDIILDQPPEEKSWNFAPRLS